MSEVVIKVENLSKQYRLGTVGTGTIKDDLRRWWATARGKEDPFLKIGDLNDRSRKGESDYIWALRDINFDVKQGEVLGVIGKNGAGKSTLLKILSQVALPTLGSIKIKGQIASLLEVGTGFHPELTGRENIFLNGAILGMTKREIRAKFDEMVEFSGVDRYIDTPVKRYSSGMYVRLAFAVAAHLEPEILIVDEVLSVGDAEFQKKCLGKMKDVSSKGRTVIFVSHQMYAVMNLCTRAIYLKHGHVVENGSPKDVVTNYLNSDIPQVGEDQKAERIWAVEDRPGNDSYRLNKVSLYDLKDQKIEKVEISQPFKVRIEYEVLRNDARVCMSFILMTNAHECLFGSLNNHEPYFYGKAMKKGTFISEVIIPDNFLNSGKFQVWLTGFSANWTEPFNVENILTFEALDDGILKNDYLGDYGGFFRPKLEWKTLKI